MKKSSYALLLLMLVVGIVLDLGIWRYRRPLSEQKMEVHMTVEGRQEDVIQIFYADGGQTTEEDRPAFSPANCAQEKYECAGKPQELIIEIPADTVFLRLDPSGERGRKIEISNIRLSYRGQTAENALQVSEIIDSQQNEETSYPAEDALRFDTGDDTYVVWKLQTEDFLQNAGELTVGGAVQKILIILVTDAVLLLIFWKRKAFFEIPLEIWRNRKLTTNLAKNDFRKRFAGSYLGIIWAFVQPIVTVVVYWFVFEKALNTGTQSTKAGIDAPYVLWLIAGLVPWFYFSEAWNSGTNTLVDYSYLVKKVVFNISTLPVVKVMSSLFVHLFFVAFMIVMYVLHGFMPTWYMLQILYYSLAMIVLVLGLVYATSAIMVFFRDLSQIVNIILQVGIWATPIMWNIDAMTSISPVVLTILKFNPMYYIVAGYRDALLDQVWFWEKPRLTLYFWLVTIIVYMIGAAIFRRLKIHFADVL